MALPVAVAAAWVLCHAPSAAAQWTDGAGSVRSELIPRSGSLIPETDSLPIEVPTEPPSDGLLHTKWWTFFAVVAILYTAVYYALRARCAKTPEDRSKLQRFMCCWADLYRGKACCFYNVVFAPVVLLLHALRIYVVPCLCIYSRRVFWRLFGCCANYFIDPEFPPESSSLGNVGGDFANEEGGRSDADVIWVRAQDFGKLDVRQRTPHPHLHNTDMCLFEGRIEAKDILQGALGDCWLLAAIATLAEHEGAIPSLFLTPEVDPRGMYRLRLFDPQEKRWRVIAVDDYVPCEKDSRQPDGVRRCRDGTPEAQYARPHGREIWAMMLEKAFAKLCGNYASIEAGITEWGIVCMTGGNAWRYEATASGSWHRSDLVIDTDPHDKRACGFRASNERHDDGQLFDLLRYYHRQGAVLCCGGVKSDGQAQGLVTKHAFSLLQVRTARTNLETDQYFRFVQIRNPWGTGEWTGPWSDEGPEWERFPHVKRELRFEKGDDGAFWMQWEDFCRYWSYVGCVDCNVGIDSLRSPHYLETDPFGPMKAMLRGCGHYWCLCAGVWHLFMTHEATSDQVHERDFRSSYGVDPSGLYCRICEQETVCVDGKGGKLIPTPATKSMLGARPEGRKSSGSAASPPRRGGRAARSSGSGESPARRGGA